MEALTGLMRTLGDALWGGPLVIVLLGLHVYLTVSLGFPQRFIWKGVRASLAPQDGAGGTGVSAFSGLMMGLAASLGVGNIVGVAFAIRIGGPGAVFWCWLTGVFGVAARYAENYLSLRCRVRDAQGQPAGGPMYVLRAMKKPRLAALFALLAAVGGLAMGAAVPANAIARTLDGSLGVPVWISGVVVAALTGLVILGGVKSIGRVCERLVPAMVGVFFAGCLWLAWQNRLFLGDAVWCIVRGAFTPAAGAGGLAGFGIGRAVHHGVMRSIFSNEAGMGTGAVSAAATSGARPARLAMAGATSCFWDTIVMYALTGIVFVAVMLASPAAAAAGADALPLAIFSQIPVVGRPMLTASLVLLAFATILGWCYIGERAFEYLLPDSVWIYRAAWVAAVLTGAMVPPVLAWAVSDVLNFLMMLPNLYAVLRARAYIRDSLKNGI